MIQNEYRLSNLVVVVIETKNTVEVFTDLVLRSLSATGGEIATSASKKPISSYISSGTYSPLNKSKKQTHQSVSNVVNSQAYEEVISATGNTVENSVDNVVTENNGTTSNTQSNFVEEIKRNNTPTFFLPYWTTQ